MSEAECTLIAPYGGRLIEATSDPRDIPELVRMASEFPSVQLSQRQVCDLQLMLTGAFSPVDRFLGSSEYQSVLRSMRLSDGTLFPMPLTLNVASPAGLAEGKRVALRSPGNNILGWMEIGEIFEVDLAAEAEAICGNSCDSHAIEIKSWGRYALSGAPRGVEPHRSLDFLALRRTPAETRACLMAMGRSRVVAFETRGDLHRSHDVVISSAIDKLGASVLLDPVVGFSNFCDTDHCTRIRMYKVMADDYSESLPAVLNLVPLAPRTDGLRDLIWHAIVRRNYGASHMIALDSREQDLAHSKGHTNGYKNLEPSEAATTERSYTAEVGVEIVSAREMVLSPHEDRYKELNRATGTRKIHSLSAGERKARFLNRSEGSMLWHRATAPQGDLGFCLWFTGLPSAGKSTIAELVAVLLQERGRRVSLLDGDVVRTHLSRGLGFSREDRDTNVLRIGFVASEIVRHHGAVICAAVSPYRVTRAQAREIVGHDHFIEVFVDTPQSECERRDVKGYYARARTGELRGFTGVDDPYEEPASPEIRLDALAASKEQNAIRVVDYLTSRGFLLPSEEDLPRAEPARAFAAGAD